MAARLILAILAAPWYGILAVLATIPVSLISITTIFLLSAALSDETTTKAVVTNLLVAIGLWILSVGIQVLITVQTARYAGAFCKLKSLSDQPPFMKAFWRGLGVMVLLNVFFTLIVISASVIFKEIWLAWGLPSPGIAALTDWSENMLAYMLAGAAAGPEAIEAARVLEALRFFGMAYTATLALALVPRVCGIGLESSAAWRPVYLLARLFIALPCCALMTAIIAGGLVLALEAVVGDGFVVLSTLISYAFQALFLLGVFFAFEALLLRGARETSVEYVEALTARAQGDPEDYRALREGWS